jgi:subtilisin family serine protease
MARSKLDPGLKYVHECIDKWRTESQFTCLVDPAVPTRQRVNILLEIEVDSQALQSALKDAGFNEHARAETIISGDVPVANVAMLGALPELKRVEASRVLRRELDQALPESKVPAVSRGAMQDRGRGVIIGLIDSGIDFRHPSFQNADGSSRILAIWDQNLKPVDGESSPEPYKYGVVYSKGEITDAIRSEHPKVNVRHSDHGPFHGTRVAGIAAGSGHPAEPPDDVVKYVGMAPNADIVVVANTRAEEHNPGTLGDSADTFDAVKFILDLAAREGKPVVINHSHGDNIGPHDGTSLLEVGIDQLITGPGKVMTKSAGNEGDTGHHAQGKFKDNKPHRVPIDVAAGSTELVMDFWYPHDDRLELRIVSPGGDDHRFPSTDDDHFRFSNGNIAFVFTDEDDAVNHDNRIFVVLQDGDKRSIEAGKWSFELNGTGSWHGWMQRDSLATFGEEFVSPMGTISIPGTAKNVISVGAYVNEGVFTADRAGELADFSSCGPTRDGRQAPTLAAPGDEITSPMPDPAVFGAMKGTSMSAPLVAGAAALMLQINKQLTAEQVREILVRTARRDRHTGKASSDQWGAGKLDVQEACKHAIESVRPTATVQPKAQKRPSSAPPQPASP